VQQCCSSCICILPEGLTVTSRGRSDGGPRAPPSTRATGGGREGGGRPTEPGRARRHPRPLEERRGRGPAVPRRPAPSPRRPHHPELRRPPRESDRRGRIRGPPAGNQNRPIRGPRSAPWRGGPLRRRATTPLLRLSAGTTDSGFLGDSAGGAGRGVTWTSRVRRGSAATAT
jgi:hypothetical protein